MSKSMKKTIGTILGIVVALAAVAGIAYLIYRYFKPDYDDEFIDDLDDAFDDDFDDDDLFEDED
ncbi:MAG: hypothetical protein K6A69_02615 [Lachnospiraceae bacterium]|nr:hypothetical protein [Lachnospiraceae bacterium]